MDVSPGMTDDELKEFIDKGEQFLYPPGDLYNQLIQSGYPRKKIDRIIRLKKRRERRKFQATMVFISFILVCIGILVMTGYFNFKDGNFEVLTGLGCCIIAFYLIRRAFK